MPPDLVVPASDFHQNRYAELLGEIVKPGDSWLDLGAGTHLHAGWTGPSQEHLAGRARLLVGCDLVRQHLTSNPFLAGKLLAMGEDLPFRADSFDVVSANMVIEHIEQPLRIFTEVRRVLRPGGRFVFGTPNRTHPVVLAASLALPAALRRALAHSVEGRKKEHVFVTFYRCNTPASIRRHGDTVGLRVRKLEAFSSFPFARGAGPLQKLEGAVITLARRERFAFLRSNLLACLERPVANQ
jgi:SAM-dependent methyltransferase